MSGNPQYIYSEVPAVFWYLIIQDNAKFRPDIKDNYIQKNNYKVKYYHFKLSVLRLDHFHHKPLNEDTYLDQ